MPTRKIRVLIVDDSAMVRAILRAALSNMPEVEVVGQARDGVEGVRQIKALKPDVVTLDIEMPNMNGIGVLERVAGKVPVAFVMVSTLTQRGARITFEALRKGAFDYVTKPEGGRIAGIGQFRSELGQKVIAAAQSKGRVRKVLRAETTTAPSLPPNRQRGWLVGIGISCGGPQTLYRVLPSFPSDFVPILITQHMPPQFTESFAAHLNDGCAMNVRQAHEGDVVRQGTILIAPGSHHLKVVRRGVDLVVKLDEGAKVAGHRPSADVMFSSMSRACGRRCIGVLMTGMGRDGADGLGELHRIGAATIAQDKESSLVWGMPRAAIDAGCVDHVVSMTRVPTAIAQVMRQRAPQPAATSG